MGNVFVKQFVPNLINCQKYQLREYSTINLTYKKKHAENLNITEQQITYQLLALQNVIHKDNWCYHT